MKAAFADRFMLFAHRFASLKPGGEIRKLERTLPGKPIRTILTLGLAAGLLLGAAPASASGTITVTSSADDTLVALDGNGTCDLREAITAANTDAAVGECPAGSGTDTITFASNYTITLNGSQLPIIDPGSTVIINGTGADTTIRASASPNTATWRVLEVNQEAALTLNHLTVSNGACALSSCSGGGILNLGTLTLNNSTVRDNIAMKGGGLYNFGTLSISNSIITNNTAKLQAGIGGYGGGIVNVDLGTYYPAMITSITNSAITGNLAEGDGGGIMNLTTIGTISSSTFSGNQAANGGGLANYGPITTLSNSTFSGNSAVTNGGGIFVAGHTITTLENSTISDNSAASAGGGGIYNQGTITTLSNSLIANNTSGGNCAIIIPPLTSTNDFTDSTGCYPGWTPTVVPGTDYSTTLADNGCMVLLPDASCVKTLALVAGSVARNASSGGTATDERGFPADGIRDVGAYEYTGELPAAPTGLTATMVDSIQIDLAWTAVTAGASYKVQRSPSGAGTWSAIATTGVNATSYSDTSALCATAYDYRLRATDAGGDSAPSSTATATTDICPTLSLTPASPHGFGVQEVGVTSPPFTITLNSTGAVPLHLVGITITGDYTFGVGSTCPSGIGIVPAGGSCTIAVTFTPTASGPRPGDVSIVSNATSSPDHFTLSGTGLVVLNNLPAPVLKTPKNGAPVYKPVVKLGWKAVKNAKGYHVEIDNGSSFAAPLVQSGDPAKPKFVTQPLDFGIYFWRVAAKDVTMHLSIYQPVPFSFEVTLNKAPKKGVTLKNGVVKFKWQVVKGASYLLEVYSDPGLTILAFPQQMRSKPNYAIAKTTPLPGGITYYWRVSSDNGAHWTLPWSFNVP